MATYKPLIVDSTGITQRLPSTDTLSVGVAIDRSSAGALTIAPSTATSIILGTASIHTTNAGNLTITGTLTGNGNTVLGDAATDTISLVASIINNIYFIKEANHVFSVVTSTTTGANGGDLTVSSGIAANGSGVTAGGSGGTLNIVAGNSGSSAGAVTGPNGGALSIVSGDGGAADSGTGGIGGQLNIQGGSGGVSSSGTGGSGGVINIIAGSGSSSNGNGGNLLIKSGVPAGSGTAGILALTSGSSSNGVVNIGADTSNTVNTSSIKLYADTAVQASKTLSTTGSGNINLPNNGSAKFKIEGTSVGATVTATNLDTVTNGSNADSLHTHSGLGSSTSITITGLTTTGTTDGYSVYVSGNSTVSHAEKTTNYKFFGIRNASGSVIVGGVHTAAVVKEGLTVNAGDYLYLSDTSGQLTNVAPNGVGDYVVEVGIVLNNSNYAGSRTVELLIQPKQAVQV